MCLTPFAKIVIIILAHLQNPVEWKGWGKAGQRETGPNNWLIAHKQWYLHVYIWGFWYEYVGPSKMQSKLAYMHGYMYDLFMSNRQMECCPSLTAHQHQKGHTVPIAKWTQNMHFHINKNIWNKARTWKFYRHLLRKKFCPVISYNRNRYKSRTWKKR